MQQGPFEPLTQIVYMCTIIETYSFNDRQPSKSEASELRLMGFNYREGSWRRTINKWQTIKSVSEAPSLHNTYYGSKAE